MASPLSLPPPPEFHDLLAQERLALFLDFDGTLVELAPEPGAIDVPQDMVDRLHRLRDTLDGRLALVTGRALDDLESHLDDITVCRAGSHGVSRLFADGSRLGRAPEGLPDAVVGELREFAAEHGLLYEAKSHGGAIHFRGAPEKEERAVAFARSVAEAHDLHLATGKSIAEIVRPGADKGGAVRAFLSEDLFAGSLPVFVGDDTTDEDGMAAANECGGFGIAVGERDSENARYHLSGVGAVHQWLEL